MLSADKLAWSSAHQCHEELIEEEEDEEASLPELAALWEPQLACEVHEPDDALQLVP